MHLPPTWFHVSILDINLLLYTAVIKVQGSSPIAYIYTYAPNQTYPPTPPHTYIYHYGYVFHISILPNRKREGTLTISLNLCGKMTMQIIWWVPKYLILIPFQLQDFFQKRSSENIQARWDYLRGFNLKYCNEVAAGAKYLNLKKIKHFETAKGFGCYARRWWTLRRIELIEDVFSFLLCWRRENLRNWRIEAGFIMNLVNGSLQQREW